MNFNTKYQNCLKKSFNLKYFGIFLIIFFFSISVIEKNDVYAERGITYEKTLDVKKETIENMLFDVNNYSKLLSSDTKLLDIIEKDDRKEIKILVDIGACTIQTGLQHSTKNDLHIVNFVSGSLKGSTLEILLQETWSFDGIENEGTSVTIDFTILDIPCVPDFLVGDDILEFALDKSLVELEHKAKEIQKEINITNNHTKKHFEMKQNIYSDDVNDVRDNRQTNSIKTISSTNSIEENVRVLAYDIAIEDNPQKQLELLERIKHLKKLQIDEKTKELELSEKKTLIADNSNVHFINHEDVIQEESKKALENNDHGKVNSLNKDISSMLIINSDKFQIEKYKPNWLEISGMIDEPKRGNTVLLTIMKPDETKQILKVFHTKDGYYQTKLFLDNNYPDGTYSITAAYDNEESTTFFQVQSK